MNYTLHSKEVGIIIYEVPASTWKNRIMPGVIMSIQKMLHYITLHNTTLTTYVHTLHYSIHIYTQNIIVEHRYCINTVSYKRQKWWSWTCAFFTIVP